MTARWLVRSAVISVALALVAVPLAAAADETSLEAVRARIAQEHPRLVINDVQRTPVSGVYEVVSGTSVMYLTADARYLFQGTLIDLEKERDLTGERRQALVHAAVDSLDDSMLVYEPNDGPAQHTITVFTDTTCPYCQRLHEDLLTMLERHPVRVRYLMFPRAGPDSAGADTLRDVWCAPDPRTAMTRAKRNEPVPASDGDCEAPVAEHFDMGRQIGIDGTPYLLLDDDGPIFSGYRSPERLLSMLGVDGETSASE